MGILAQITKPLQSTTSYNRFRIGTLPVLNITNGTALNDFWYMNDGGTTTAHTITTGANANYLFVYFAKATTATNPGGEVQEVLDGLQIEKGSTATDYEPYQGQSYKINLGKNLFQAPTAAKSTWQAVYTKLTSNSVTVAKSAPAISGTSAYAEVDLFGLLPNTTYTLSYETTVSGTPQIGAGTARSRVNGVWLRLSVDNKLTFTTDASAIASVGLYALYGTDVAGDTTVTFYNIQLEVGTNASEYAPHFAPIELYKIGDYQDYIYKSGDDWYLHKETSAKTIDGTETGWGKSGVSQNNAYYLSTDIFNDMNRDGMGTSQFDTHITPTLSRYFLATSSNDIFTTDTVGLGFNAQTPPNQRLDLRIGLGLNSSLNTVQLFKDWLGANKLTIYYALATPVNILIENPILVAQLNALAKARSYNDQTNIIVTTAGENLPATLCVEAYRKSLSGVIEAIDSACTCRKNLVVYLPNGMTTYTNNDAPIPIPEVLEALKRGQSVFLVDGALYESIYTVTAASMEDGIWSMRADQTGVSPRGSDGHWHISGGGDVWDSVTFINDATPSKYSPNIYEKTWFAFAESTPLLDQYRRTYYPASSDMTFNSSYGNLSVAELWGKLASSAWDGNPVILEVPLQDISTRTTNLVDVGFLAVSPYLTISVSLGPDNYFERETPEYTITGWAAEWTPLVYDRKGVYTVGIVRVVEDGNTTYSFVVSLTEVVVPPR